jgi:mono/diheme cytochrome c family protein
MESIVACANCHTPKDPATGEEIEGLAYAGSFVITEPGFTAYAPNITMDTETGIGDWTDEQIIVAIRDGLRPDGTLIGPPMPSPFYRTMSDYDARAIVAYMRTIKPVNNVVPQSEYDIPLPTNYGPKVGSVPDVGKDDPVAYGQYVTNSLGHCTGCHTPLVKGKLDFSRTNIGGRIFENIAGLGFTTVRRGSANGPTGKSSALSRRASAATGVNWPKRWHFPITTILAKKTWTPSSPI